MIEIDSPFPLVFRKDGFLMCIDITIQSIESQPEYLLLKCKKTVC